MSHHQDRLKFKFGKFDWAFKNPSCLCVLLRPPGIDFNSSANWLQKNRSLNFDFDQSEVAKLLSSKLFKLPLVGTFERVQHQPYRNQITLHLSVSNRTQTHYPRFTISAWIQIQLARESQTIKSIYFSITDRQWRELFKVVWRKLNLFAIWQFNQNSRIANAWHWCHSSQGKGYDINKICSPLVPHICFCGNEFVCRDAIRTSWFCQFFFRTDGM